MEREGKGYESKENFSYNKQNYNYVSLTSLNTKNVEKRKLGDCSLTIHRINDFEKTKFSNLRYIVPIVR